MRNAVRPAAVVSQFYHAPASSVLAVEPYIGGRLQGVNECTIVALGQGAVRCKREKRRLGYRIIFIVDTKCAVPPLLKRQRTQCIWLELDAERAQRIILVECNEWALLDSMCQL
jgi:hypothetical protein